MNETKEIFGCVRVTFAHPPFSFLRASVTRKPHSAGMLEVQFLFLAVVFIRVITHHVCHSTKISLVQVGKSHRQSTHVSIRVSVQGDSTVLLPAFIYM